MTAVITAFVLVQLAPNHIPETAEAIAELDGVSDVYSCAGNVDLIVVVRTTQPERVAEIVTDDLRKISGVLHTETYPAFRSFARRDIERGFAVGQN